MSDSRHAKIKQIFLEACERSPENRAAYLDVACAGDVDLRREVESLLAYDADETVIPQPTQRVQHSATVSLPSHEKRRRIRLTLQSVPWGSRLIPIVALFVAMLISYVVYDNVRAATRRMLERDLQRHLAMFESAFETWMRERQADTRFWAGMPEVARLTQELRNLEFSDDVRADELRIDLERTMGLHRLLSEKLDWFLVDDSCRILSAPVATLSGKTVEPEIDAALAPVFRGETVVGRKCFQSSLVRRSWPGHPLDLVVWIAAPVRAPDDEIIATFILAIEGDHPYVDGFCNTGFGESGQTFVFDRSATILTVGAYAHIEGGQHGGRGPEWVLRVPSVRLEASEVPLEPRSEWPLTRMAQDAIDSANQSRATTTDWSGVNVDGYQDCRGEFVVGAWKWLNEYEVGIATEVDWDEAYSPIHTPRVLLIACGVALAVCMLVASVVAVRLHAARKLVTQTRFGQYELVRQIGEGGLARVYECRHALLKRLTAIKVLKSESVKRDSERRFEREVQIASQLKHPNTVTIFDFGITEEHQFYCVMELLDGPTLAKVSYMSGPLPVPRAIHFLRQIASSLEEAHAQGLVHRDIKPENIMLTGAGGEPDFIKVLDFGIARPLEVSDSAKITADGMVVGTPLYMAPERFLGATQDAPSVDIYSLGVLAFLLLTGEDLYNADSQLKLVYEITHGQPRSVSSVDHRGRIPAELVNLVDAMTSREPCDRPDSIQAVRAQLDQLASEHPWPETSSLSHSL